MLPQPHYEKLKNASENPKYREEDKFKKFFEEAFTLYNEWRARNLELKGCDESTIKERVKLLNWYKDMLDYC